MLRIAITTIFILTGPLLASPLQAACVVGTSSEPSLQSVFDDILPAGSIHVVNDCLSDVDDTLWRQDGGSPTTTIVVELAGFASQNVFGLYDSDDSSNQVNVFDGAMGSGDSASISFSIRGDGRFDVSVDGLLEGDFGSDQFGFFLTTPQSNTFFSDSSLNSDGSDHMYSYNGSDPGIPFSGTSALAGLTFDSMFYLLAFEDLDARSSGYDADFQDFVVGAQFVAPIPLPAPLLLILSGLGFLHLLRTRAQRTG